MLPTLKEVIEREPRFSTLEAALEATDLLASFEDEGPFTIFAPSDQAFADLPGALSIDALTAPRNRELLLDLLSLHVVSGTLKVSEMEGQTLSRRAINDSMLRVDGTGPVITVNESVLTITDIEAENGVIHVLDSVLLPPSDL
ncbi:MAG: fasciclin domain-containing protein [Pseudomonadota bacterium]